MKKLTGLIAAAAIGGFMMSAAPAYAVVDDCANSPPNVSGDVSPSLGCQFSDTLGPSQPTIGEVNAEMFFGISDWADSGSGGGAATNDSNPVNVTDGDLNIQGNNLSGSWSIANFDANLTYMLLFKDGNNALPGTVVGYLISAAMGTYDGIFSNKPEGAISNIRLLISSSDPNCCDNQIPLPAAGFLLIGALGALGGLGAYRRRQMAA